MRIVVQLFSVPVLARYLSPVDYGLAAMAMPVILFVMMIADAGLGASLVRTGNSDQPAWHTCFWLSADTRHCARERHGTSLAGDRASPERTPHCSLNRNTRGNCRLTDLHHSAWSGAQQQGRFGTIAATEIVTIGASVGTAVICAIEGRGVWSLIWQQLVLYAVRLTLTLTCSPYRPRLIFGIVEAT